MKLLKQSWTLISSGIMSPLPGWFVLPGWRRHWSRIIVVDGSVEEFQAQLSDLPRGERVRLVISGRNVLTRRVLVPKVARKQAVSVLGLDLQRTSPNANQALVWRHRLLTVEDNEVTYEQFVVRLSLVDRVIDIVKSQGLRLDAVFARDQQTQPLVARVASTTSPVWAWWTLTFVVIISFATLSFFDLTTQRTRAAAAYLNASLENTRLIAQTAAAKKAALDSEVTAREVEGDLAAMRKHRSALEILSQTTIKLPDYVWISEFSLDGDQLTLAGFSSGTIPSLHKEVSAWPWVVSARLNGQTTVDRRSGDTRFELIATIDRKVFSE